MRVMTGRLGLLVALLAWALLLSVTSGASPPLARLSSGVLQPEAAATTAAREHVLVESQSQSQSQTRVEPDVMVQKAFALLLAHNDVRHLDQLRKGVVVASQKTDNLPEGEQFKEMMEAKRECGLRPNPSQCIRDVGIAWGNGETLAKWMKQLVLIPQQSLKSTVHPQPEFTYTLDAAGRVTRAEGFALNQPGLASAPVGAGAAYCQTLMRPTRASVAPAAGELNNFAAGGKSQGWSMGHIVAATLGGSNTEALNFFPQRKISNDGGRWKQAEDLAGYYLDRQVQGLVDIDCVEIAISFEYENAAVWIPRGGTYTVRVNPLCLRGDWEWGQTAPLDAATGRRVWTTNWAQEETPASVGEGGAHAKRTTPTCTLAAPAQ